MNRFAFAALSLLAISLFAGMTQDTSGRAAVPATVGVDSSVTQGH